MEQYCQDKVKIAIVGAGPSGIYCALQLLFGFQKNNFTNFYLTIFDKSQALRTILPTGGGRCNITNGICDIEEFILNYPRGQKFLRSLFSRHFSYDSLDFFKKIGIETYLQEDNRYFPISNSSKDVKDKMLNALKQFKNVKLVNKNILNAGDLNDFDRVVIAAGSRSTSDLIKSFNQPMIEFKRALCALKVENFKYPKGVSVKSLDGDFIFTDNGISGPLAFKISSLRVDDDFPYVVNIRLFDFNVLSELVKNNPKKSIGNLVSRLIPKSLAYVIVKDYDKKSAEISKKDLESYSNLTLKIVSHGLNGEIVNKGGVELNSLDKNCKSKITPNLWFCGEILNIDGFCGGFNLQNCWSSAYVVACDIINSIIKN